MADVHEEQGEGSHWPISVLFSLSSSINIFIPLIMVRIFPPEEVGSYKIFFLYVMIAPVVFGSEGLRNGFSYFAGKRDDWSRYFQTTGTCILLIAIAASFALLSVQSTLSSNLHFSSAESLLFTSAIFAAITSKLYEDAAIAKGRIWRAARFHILFELPRTGAIVAFALIFQSLEAVFFGHTLLALLKSFAGIWLGAKEGYLGRQFSLDSLRSVLRYGVPVSGAAILGIGVSHFDQLILSQTLEPAVFALYAIGCLAVPPLVTLERTVAQVLIPKMAGAFEAGLPERAAELYQQSVRTLTFLLIPSAAALAVFAEPIIELLFTEAYREAVPILRVFSLSYVFLAFPYDAAARALGDAKWILGNLTRCSILTLAVTGSGTYFFGLYGALAGLLFGAAIMRFYAFRYMLRNANWKLSEFLPESFLVNLGFATLFWSLVAITMAPLFESELFWFLLVSPLMMIGTWVSALVAEAVLVPSRSTHREEEGVRGLSVVMMLQNFNVGGLERMALEICSGLKQAGAEVKVIAYDQGKADLEKTLYPKFQEAGLSLVVRSKGDGFSVRSLSWVAMRLNEACPDVLHCHDIGGMVYGILAKLLSAGKCRVVLTQHSFLHLESKRRYRWYERILSLFVDEIVVVSKKIEASYQDLGVRNRRFVHIPNGVSFAVPLPRERQLELRKELAPKSVEQGKRWVVSVARLFPGKGQDTFLSLWSEVPEEIRREYALFIVGPSSDAEYLEKLRRLAAPFSEVVVVPERVDTLDWLRAADLFVSASQYEGLPLTGLEAVGSGVPLLLSRISGHELFEEFSEYFSAHDREVAVQQITATLKGELLEAPKPLRNYDQAASWRETYSVEAMVHRYIALYENLVRGEAESPLRRLREASFFCRKLIHSQVFKPKT